METEFIVSPRLRKAMVQAVWQRDRQRFRDALSKHMVELQRLKQAAGTKTIPGSPSRLPRGNHIPQTPLKTSLD